MNSHDASTTIVTVPERVRHERRRILGGAGSMAVHLTLFAVLLVSLTAALVGTLSYTRARRALEEEARSRLTLLARDVAEHLHRELEDRAADTMNWVHLEVMRALLYRDVDKELAQFLRQIVSGRRLYRTIAALNAAGEVVASAGTPAALAAGAPPPRPRLSVVALDDGRGLRLDAAIQHPDRPGEAIGTLVVLLDRERLLDSVQASVGPRGTTPSVTVEEDGGAPVLVGSALEARGRAAITGRATVDAVPAIDGPALSVVVAEPRSVVLASVVELRTTLLEFLLVALLVGSGLGVLLAWRISAPIRRLTTTVRGITAPGPLDASADFPTAAGEIGVLSSAFRSMLERLTAAQAEALAQSRRAFLGEIAANVAHEVRTPLSVLKTSAQLLARQQLPESEQRRLAENVTAEVDRLNRVVTNLVDLARPQPVRYRDHAVGEIVARAIAFFAPQAEALGVELQLQPSDGSARIHGNADQLHQVLLNVMHNALQAMNGPGRLTIASHAEPGWSEVDIRDNGPGFAPDVLAYAFAPFRTSKEEGTGLGLAISRRIVEEHGGTIVAENDPGGGACIRIRLPSRSIGA